jgi:hypothetical protein
MIFSLRKKYQLPELSFLVLLIGWISIILLGLSIPDDKKVRYLLPMAPALALLSAYPFIQTSIAYFVILRKIMSGVFFSFPGILLLISLGLMFNGWQINIIFPLLFFIFQVSHFIFYQELSCLSISVLSFIVFQIAIIEPWQIEKDKARDFVLHTEAQRLKSQSHLVFYKEKPDSLPVKYLIHMKDKTYPQFISDSKTLQDITAPTFFVTSKNYYDDLVKEKFQLIAENTIGHVPVVVFIKRNHHV